jgi:hypothetical protein
VLGCVGVPASVLALWTHNQVADTDRAGATMSRDRGPFVQSALAEQRRMPGAQHQQP